MIQLRQGAIKLQKKLKPISVTCAHLCLVSNSMPKGNKLGFYTFFFKISNLKKYLGFRPYDHGFFSLFLGTSKSYIQTTNMMVSECYDSKLGSSEILVPTNCSTTFSIGNTTFSNLK